MGDLGVAHTGRGGAGQADVGDQHVVAAVRASTPTALSPRAAAAVTWALTSGANRLVPWMRVAVVGGADQHPGTQRCSAAARR